MCSAAGDGALLELVGLAHVEHHRARRLAQLLGGGGVHLADLGFGLLEQVSEGGHLYLCSVPRRLKGYRTGQQSSQPVIPPTMTGSSSEMEPRTTTSARSSISVGSALTMTTDGPGLAGGGHHGRHRVHAQGRADGQQQVAGGGGLEGPVQVGLDQGLAEGDGGRLEHAATGQAGRIGLAGPDPLQGGPARRPLRRSRGTPPGGWCRGPRPPGLGSIPAAWWRPSMFWVTRVCERRPGGPAPPGRGGRRWAGGAAASQSRRPCQARRRTSGSRT